MLRFSLLFLGSLLFVQCNSADQGSSDSEYESNIEQPESTQVNDSLDQFTEFEDQNPQPFFLEKMPATWIMLTDINGNGEGMVIQHYCEAETQMISFSAEKGDVWYISLAYGQDGEICEISNFEAESKEMELMQIVEGGFQFKGAYKEETSIVKFIWNQDEMYGRFEGLGMRSMYFVPEEDKSNYTEIFEDCEGLWDEY